MKVAGGGEVTLEVPGEGAFVLLTTICQSFLPSDIPVIDVPLCLLLYETVDDNLNYRLLITWRGHAGQVTKQTRWNQKEIWKDFQMSTASWNKMSFRIEVSWHIDKMSFTIEVSWQIDKMPFTIEVIWHTDNMSFTIEVSWNFDKMSSTIEVSWQIDKMSFKIEVSWHIDKIM
ncbi:hypothetical protein Btru_064945 [Bulinus truncatus]|nr:hypothetical protein Btru_064945 [Bulinus truncatus]